MRNSLFILFLLVFQLGFLYLHKDINTHQKSNNNNNEKGVVNENTKESNGLVDNRIALKGVDPRVEALLLTIRKAEGTSGREGYRIQFTGRKFSSFNKHPDEKICAYIPVLGYEECSTAAGAYQYLTTTWNEIVAANPHITSFSPQNQDRAAIILLKELKVIPILLKRKYPTNKELEKVFFSINKTWASIYGAPYGQGTKSLSFLVNTYNGYLNYIYEQQ